MNRKKLAALTLAAALALSLTACGEPAASPASSAPVETAEAGLTFADLQECQFVHASGAGSWGTALTIRPDGSFSGSFSDTDWEEREDGSTQPVCYHSIFTGQLAQPVRVNDYTYSVHIDRMDYAQEVGTDEYADGFHYYYTEPRGLEDTEELLIYLPGAPTAELPEEFLDWVGYADAAEGELPFYALNNAVHQQGFSSYDRLESIRESLEGWVEPYAAELETEIQRDASLSQGGAQREIPAAI